MVQYNGEHSVIIGDKNTWDDWHLIPASRPFFAYPTVQTKYVDIPGRNGRIDLSEVYGTGPLYGDRSGTIDFVLPPGYGEWHDLMDQIANYLHGRRLKAILQDDPMYYYEGRFAVSSRKSDELYSTISINYDLDPFKIEADSNMGDWMWDPFNFEKDYAYNYAAISVSGSTSFSLRGSDIPASPTIYASSSMTMVIDGTSYSISSGTQTYSNIKIGPGSHTVSVSGNGTLSINLKRVSL